MGDRVDSASESSSWETGHTPSSGYQDDVDIDHVGKSIKLSGPRAVQNHAEEAKEGRLKVAKEGMLQGGVRAPDLTNIE